MPLYTHRRHLADRAAAATRGEPYALVYDFDGPVRAKLQLAIHESWPPTLRQFLRHRGQENWFDKSAARLILRDTGRTLQGSTLAHEIAAGNTDQVLDALEVWFLAMDDVLLALGTDPVLIDLRKELPAAKATCRDRVNAILDEHDLAYQIVGEEVMPRTSTAMHATIVEPVLALVGGDPSLVPVEQAYAAALRELKPGGSPADAVTDAGTALQQALMARGAVGTTLGQVIQNGTARGLLAERDGPLAAGIDAIGGWIRDERNQRGDAHNVVPVSKAEAWLAVRVAGALILRVLDPTP